MIRILLVDDEHLNREILRDCLSFDPQLTIVGEASNGRAAITQASALCPDVILMDMQMPIMDGVAATQVIHSQSPEIRIIGLTSFSTDRYVVDALRAGAAGYLVKDTKPRDIVAAIHAIMAGESVLSPEVTRFVVHGLEASIPAHVGVNRDEIANFTDKELEVIQLLSRGMSNREMAAALFVTESTIKARLVKVMSKLNVRDRVQILVSAVERGLVNIKPRPKDRSQLVK